MNKNEQAELLRWAAEEMLGWVDQGFGLPLQQLTGWQGFGLAVEAANAKGLYVRLHQGRLGFFFVVFANKNSVSKGGGTDENDPGIAAWLALKEALSGG